jgi:hypothetical protein
MNRIVHSNFLPSLLLLSCPAGKKVLARKSRQEMDLDVYSLLFYFFTTPLRLSSERRIGLERDRPGNKEERERSPLPTFGQPLVSPHTVLPRPLWRLSAGQETDGDMLAKTAHMRSERALCASERSFSPKGHEHDRGGLSVMDEQFRYVVHHRRMWLVNLSVAAGDTVN